MCIVLCTCAMCTLKTSASHTAAAGTYWTRDTSYGTYWSSVFGVQCSLPFTNMIIIVFLLLPFSFSFVNYSNERVSWKFRAFVCDMRCAMDDDTDHSTFNECRERRKKKKKKWEISLLATYVPSNSLRWYFSSIENCLSGSRRSRLDFFVESFFPNSGILEFFKLLIQNKFSY